MPIQFKCTSCNASISAPESAAGRRGKCPRCGIAVSVPARADPAADGSSVVTLGPATRAAEPLPNLPGFRIIDEVGRGGMGVVYRAVDERLDREVAVKLLNATTLQSPGLLMRFQRGCKAAARLEHPNIVAIRSLELDHQPPFLVMELVVTDDGKPRNLEDVVQQCGAPLPHNECVNIIGQLCEALRFAHTNGIVHRDIKPTNVLASRAHLFKLADFELAHIVPGSPADESGSVLQSAELSRSGVIVGTLDYMSPEQRAGRIADERSDVYSVCAVAHYLITGVPPVGFPPPIDVGDALLSNAWAALLRKGMAADPGQRFATVSDLAADVRAIDEPSPLPAAVEESNPLLDAAEEDDIYKLADGPAVPTRTEPASNDRSGVRTTARSVAPRPPDTSLELDPVLAKVDDTQESRDLTEKAADRLIGRAEEHRVQLDELRDIRNHVVGHRELPELIEHINRWSNSKVGYIRNLGDHITVTRAVRSDAVIGDLDLLMFHRRLVLQPVDPRSAQGTTEEDADQRIDDHLRETGLPTTGEFGKVVPRRDVPIPGAVLTRSCQECSGHGALKCGACNGQGRSRCSKCGGSGQYTKTNVMDVVDDISSHYNELQSKAPGRLHRERRAQVKAARKIANTSPCDKCGGTGMAECGWCGGTGEKRCSSCKGTGELLTQLAIRQRIWPYSARVVATDSAISLKSLEKAHSNAVLYEGTVDVTTGGQARGDAIEITSGQAQSGVARTLTEHGPVPVPIAKWMQSLVAGANSLGTSGAWTPKPIGLRLRVRRVTIDTVEFEYGGSPYVVHIAGADHAVFPERVPSRGKAAFRAVGSLIKGLWQSGHVDPVQEAAKLGDRFSKNGVLVHVCDHDMRLITLLEERGFKVSNTGAGYKVEVPLDGGKVQPISIRLDGWAVRLVAMVSRVAPGQFRQVLCSNAQLFGGAIGIVDTKQGPWFCATQATVYDSASADELAAAVDNVVRLARATKSGRMPDPVSRGVAEEGTLSQGKAMRLLADLARRGTHKPTHVDSNEIMFRVKCPSGRVQPATAQLAGPAGFPEYFVFESVCAAAHEAGLEAGLKLNGLANFSAVVICPHDGVDHLVLRHVRPIADCDPEEVQVAIEDVAVLADQLSVQLVGA